MAAAQVIVLSRDNEKKKDTTSVYILVPRQHRTGANPFHMFRVAATGVGVFSRTMFDVMSNRPFV